MILKMVLNHFNDLTGQKYVEFGDGYFCFVGTCSGELCASTAAHRMQIALDKISAWTEKWCLQINKDKSASTLFSLSKQKPVPLNLGGVPLQHVDEQVYLGVNFDKRQTWKTTLELLRLRLGEAE